MTYKQLLSISIFVFSFLSTSVINANDLTYEATRIEEFTQLVRGELTPDNIQSSYSFTGDVIDVWVHSSGLRNFKLVNDSGLYIEAVAFKNIGQLPDINIGDHVIVAGELGKYKNKWQLALHSKESIKRIRESNSDLASKAISLKAASSQVNQTMWIGPVIVPNYDLFISKSGKKHLKISLRDESIYSANGIIWEGNWDSETKKNLDAKQKYYVLAEVSTYKGRSSYVVSKLVVKK